MAGSVRERRPGLWELRPYLGRDPLTGKKRYGSRVVTATGKRDAQAQCDRWSVELEDGTTSVTAGTFGDLAAQWIDPTRMRLFDPETGNNLTHRHGVGTRQTRTGPSSPATAPTSSAIRQSR